MGSIMFEIDSTRKHYVPILYLQNFETQQRSDQIYVFDKQWPKTGVEARAITKVEVSKDAYSVLSDNILKERENYWGSIVRDLKGIIPID